MATNRRSTKLIDVLDDSFFMEYPQTMIKKNKDWKFAFDYTDRLYYSSSYFQLKRLILIKKSNREP